MNVLALRAGAVVVAISLWSLFVWTKGAAHVQTKWDKVQIEEERRSMADVVRLAKAASEIDLVYVHTTGVVREKTVELIKKVPVYVSKESDAKCDIPVGFVRLWDEPLSAAIDPSPASIGNDVSSGLALSEVARDGVVKAKERFELNKASLVACQSYVVKIQETFNAP